MYHLATCFWVSDCTHSTGFVGCANTKGFQTIFQGADGFPWKACERQKRFASSNLALSASKRLIFNRLQSKKNIFLSDIKKTSAMHNLAHF